jgi:hypothetical protein
LGACGTGVAAGTVVSVACASEAHAESAAVIAKSRAVGTFIAPF